MSKWWRNKLIYILDGLRVSKCSFFGNYSINLALVWICVNWPFYLFQAFLPIRFLSALVFIHSHYSWKTPSITCSRSHTRLRWKHLLMFSAGTLTTAGSIRLSARTKAPSSRVSSNIVAAWVCSVEFMSSQDLRASGLRRLSTVSTMACNHGNKRNDRRLIFVLCFPWE